MKQNNGLAELQKRHFSLAERKRFFWQTQNPYIIEREKELLAILAKENSDNVLEVGCGEGANITNLKDLACNMKFITGIDFSKDKVAFCQSNNLDNAQFSCANALNLPFSDGSFDLVFCRDLLHHVNHNREKAISEMIRVCKRGGKIVIIESNGVKSTLILFANLSPAERGMIDSTPGKLRKLIKRFENTINLEEFFMFEPSNLFRVVFHYQFGLPFLANFRICRTFLDLINLITKMVLSENKWAYSVVLMRKKA